MERRYLVGLGAEEETLVTVETASDIATIRVGDHTFVAQRLPDGGMVVHLPGGRVRRVDVVGKGESFDVTLGGHVHMATARSERDAWLGAGRGHGASGGRVTTSMPGKIVKILVKEGDAVTVGQGMLILEAMKMENEVRAPMDGVVARIHVTEGGSVESDALLAEVVAPE